MGMGESWRAEPAAVRAGRFEPTSPRTFRRRLVQHSLLTCYAEKRVLEDLGRPITR